MNYIELIREFWRSHEEQSFTCTDIALYFYLLEVCNVCRWKNPFKRNNSRILSDLGISIKTLVSSRNRLVQGGVLSVKSKAGVANVLYTLANIPEVGAEVRAEVRAEVGGEVRATKYKQNKTKQNSLEKENLKEKEFVRPLEEDVAAYCLDRKNTVDAGLFHAFYESKGWYVGKNPMKDWRAAVRAWEKNPKNRSKAAPHPFAGYNPAGFENDSRF